MIFPPPATDEAILIKRGRGVRSFAVSRRLFDIAGAGVGLILLSPVFGVVSLLIALTDGRPVFFRQKRIGRKGRPFFILKFRTMPAGSRGLALTASGDERVTRIGAPLRRYKIDELPQLWNVLAGDMSLIGPRPEVPEFVELDDQLWKEVLQAPPGITDLASLAFRNEEKLLASASDPAAYYRSEILPEKLRLNICYQNTRTLLRDCRLLWMTAFYSLFPESFDRGRIARWFGA